MNDEALVARAQKGDELAMRRLLNRHERFVRLICANYFMAGADRDDLLQEGRWGAFKAVRDFQPDAGADFRAFLLVCVRRQAITAVKTANRIKHLSLNDAVSLNQPVIGGDDWEDPPLAEVLPDRTQREPVDVLIERGEVETVVEVVGGMSEAERSVTIGLAEGRSYAEVAAREGRRIKHVDNAHQRGKRKIRAALEAAA